MKRLTQLFFQIVAIGFLFATPRARAVLANAWHIPDNSTDLGFTMRNPEFEMSASNTVTIYSGVQKFNNSYGTANQTGGTLFFKGATQGSWGSTNFSFHQNGGPSPNNQYWKASFNTSAFGTNEVIQYYLYLTFDGVNNVSNTYVFGRDADSSTTATQSVAQASPFTIRNRPAWLFHGSNRVLNPGSDASHQNVDILLKAGYVGKDDSVASRYADNGRIYFTTDGSTPVGSLGNGSNTTQVAIMTFDHRENDPSSAGNAMWWKGTVTNVPLFATLKYKISLWHSANSEEKFAEYNAVSNNTVFTYTLGTLGDPVLTVNNLNADYTTTHLFVDEVAGDSIPLTILFTPNAANLSQIEVFSNLNRRDRATLDANGDGIEDGIVAPDGNSLVAGDDSNYYKAYIMTATGTPGQFSLTLNAQKTGAYRLTARYKVTGNTNWFWYSSNERRDHCVVVSPKKAREIVLYELNTLNVESQGINQNDRSTFTDLHDGPGSRPYNSSSARFNLNYLTSLGVNWLWFQPIHPQGIDGRQTDPDTGQPYEVGSPYAVKNFFEVMPLMSKANTRAAAMQEFTNFVTAADSAGVSVMLDAPFNHTAYDCELAASGVFYFSGGATATDEIRNKESRFYSASGDYCQRASSAGNVAVAPDRGDFGKFGDTHDVYFGRYAALVCQNPSDNGNYLNEGDWFDTNAGTGNFDGITQNVWKYFADYTLYWLDKTGCPAGTPANQTYKGIDGLRADFGQGLPPQCWEYIINKARSRKWDFVFMSESLDGGAVTYRSNRHFDILNENILFGMKSAAAASDYRNLFESRRASYGQGLVLLNNTSHDEENYDDPFQALIRYLVCGAMDGAPMIFSGQEMGISRTFGYDRYELNFGKTIPHFKKFNSMQLILNPANRNFGLDQLYPVFAAIGQARQFSRALRSSNRYFLDQTGGGSQPNIFSVAKYETANGAPNFNDVVFAFASLDRNNDQQGNFNVNITQNGANLFGIKSNRIYNVKNIAAYTAADANRRNYFLIPGNTTGTNLLNNGLFALLKKVPTSDGAWTNAPMEAQYLKLYDVTPPPAVAPPGPTNSYVLANYVTFTWPAVSDPEGGVFGYHVIVGSSLGGSNVFDGIVTGTSLTVTNTYGVTLYAKVSALNNAGIEGMTSVSSAGTILVDPSWIPVMSINSTGVISWTSVFGKNYQVWSTTNLAAGFSLEGGVVQASGPVTSVTNSPDASAKYFKVQLVLP